MINSQCSEIFSLRVTLPPDYLFEYLTVINNKGIFFNKKEFNTFCNLISSLRYFLSLNSRATISVRV